MGEARDVGPTVWLKHFAQTGLPAAEFSAVRRVAEDLYAYLQNPTILEQFRKANVPGASSSSIQNLLGGFATKWGFRSELHGLFGDYSNRGLRPDFYTKIGEAGVLLEVERGKTTINNMDLLDFWKCHLCVHANYLFLLVPQALRQNPSMTARKEFQAVVKRLSTFFEPRNYTNVRAVFIFGY